MLENQEIALNLHTNKAVNPLLPNATEESHFQCQISNS